MIYIVGLVLLKYGMCSAPGDGWFYSGSGGFENNCPKSECQADCGIGEYRLGCSGGSNGACVSCNNKPANSTYTTRGGLNSNCAWNCDLKYTLAGVLCVENSCTKPIPPNSTYILIYPICDHQCNAGYYNPFINPTSCYACQAGKYSLQGNPCADCPAGTFSGLTASPSGVNCQACPAGTYSVNPGASLISACQSCQAGTYASTAGASSASICLDCPAGTSSTGANKACVPCDIGTYSSTGKSCDKCEAGTFASDVGATKCKACPVNTFANSTGMASCFPCDICSTDGIYRAYCGPISSGYCSACTNPLVR
jgi:syndecan 4